MNEFRYREYAEKSVSRVVWAFPGLKSSASFWPCLALLLFGSLIWAHSRDPFRRTQFKARTANGDTVHGIVVLPRRLDESLALPVVVYTHGSGGSWLTDGNDLRQFAELGVGVVGFDYDQTNSSTFDGEFSAVLDYVRQQTWANANALAWVGSSLGAQNTLRYLISGSQSSTVPKPQVYVRLSGGWIEEMTNQEARGKNTSIYFTLHSVFPTVLLVHGEDDAIFSVDDAKRLAASLRSNGTAVDLRTLPGHGHGFGTDHAVVIRLVAEYCKAKLTPAHPLPDFPQLHPYPFLLCISPAFVWAGLWFYVRRKNGRAGTPCTPSGSAGSGVPALPKLATDLHRFAQINQLSVNKPNQADVSPSAWQEGEGEGKTDSRPHLNPLPQGEEADGAHGVPALPGQALPLTKWEIGLRVAAVVLGVAAVGDTALHLIPPHLQVTPPTLAIARKYLLAPQWHQDFETLAALPIWQGQKLNTLLEHVNLAHYTVFELVNWKVDDAIYRQYVLSPTIDNPLNLNRNPTPNPSPELNWRRQLWENFYPRVRHENTTADAAVIVVRFLRQRVTIAPDYPKQPGVESMWNGHIVNLADFEILYVAALRSTGVPARLNASQQAEFWTGQSWQAAPRPLATTWVE